MICSHRRSVSNVFFHAAYGSAGQASTRQGYSISVTLGAMQASLNPGKAAPEPYKAVVALETHLKGAVEPRLYHLLKLRASQINGCAFCIDMHVKEALDDGEDPQRLHLLSAWRGAPLLQERGRGAPPRTQAATALPPAAAAGGRH